MKKNILKIRPHTVLKLCKLAVGVLLGLIVYRFRKIYIISESGAEARDNGYHMFKYITENHPEKDIYYIISKDSVDYEKVAKLGKTIDYDSWKHLLYFIAARVKISNHIMGYFPKIVDFLFYKSGRRLYFPGKHIFLQHGITQNNPDCLNRSQTKLDLFICGAKPEYEFVKRNFGHPNGVVQYTGFARHDALHGHTPKRQILVMPTWRKFLFSLSKEEFRKTEYYKNWSLILNNTKISELLQKHNLELYFYPHYNMQKFIDCFEVSNENVHLASFDEYDVQQLLIESALLITDFSSVFFDFAYMKKPCVYYQFDRDAFRSGHLAKGYFDYDKDVFGDVAFGVDQVVASVQKCIENDFVMEDKYFRLADEFFELHDNRNCERIYNAIEEIQ